MLKNKPYLVGQHKDGHKEVLSDPHGTYITLGYLVTAAYQELDNNDFERVILYDGDKKPMLTMIQGEHWNEKARVESV
jgi:hypothetical protein